MKRPHDIQDCESLYGAAATGGCDEGVVCDPERECRNLWWKASLVCTEEANNDFDMALKTSLASCVAWDLDQGT